MQALRLGREMFPETSIFQEVMDIGTKHYEVPHLYEEPGLTELENRLFEGLKLLASKLRDAITILPQPLSDDPYKWKDAIKKVEVDPRLLLFDGAKFSRLMKGRLKFYANAPTHFDTTWCIQNDVNRMGNNFFRTPFKIFEQVVYHQKIDDPAEKVPDLVPEILSKEEMENTLAFDRLTREKCKNGQEVETANQIAEIFDSFFHALFKISKIVRQSDDPKES